MSPEYAQIVSLLSYFRKETTHKACLKIDQINMEVLLPKALHKRPEKNHPILRNPTNE
jgi:hypothetical protein